MGISDVGAFMRAIPKWWRPLRYEWVTRVGDAEGNATLNKAISPIYHIDRIQAPLMIGQGANDPRVRQAESDRIAGALSRRGAAVTCACVGGGTQGPCNNAMQAAGGQALPAAGWWPHLTTQIFLLPADILYPDEGHGLVIPANRLDFYSRAGDEHACICGDCEACCSAAQLPC
jgi:hypothetical protein